MFFLEKTDFLLKLKYDFYLVFGLLIPRYASEFLLLLILLLLLL